MGQLRVLYILTEYPQISQTYIQAEMDAIRDECEVGVISVNRPNLAYAKHLECRYLSNPDQISEAIDEFRPQVLHSHYLTQTELIANLARRKNIPFSIRTHSFDSIWANEHPSLSVKFRRLFRKAELPPYIRQAVSLVNDELCLGILAFPFLRSRLERVGFDSRKIYDCYPAMNYQRFYDSSPNGRDVMNVGACLPKKNMADFIRLAQLVRDRAFNLYALGYGVESIARLNEDMGQAIKVIPPIEPADMPREYKKHAWLVYTADRELGTVGWPVSIAEAQASGLGVCMPNLRPDLRDYLGPAGFLYDSIGDVARFISQPFPEEMRQLGFEHAKKSDVFHHKQILIDLWQKAVSVSSPAS
jgi:glycosyltransferase involved in cell wall biosynthesis